MVTLAGQHGRGVEVYRANPNRNQRSRLPSSFRRKLRSSVAGAVVIVVSEQAPVFVVVVAPLTELTDTLQELLDEQFPLVVVVVTPLTELTDTLQAEELLTDTLLERLDDDVVSVAVAAVGAGVVEANATRAPMPAMTARAASTATFRN